MTKLSKSKIREIVEEEAKRVIQICKPTAYNFGIGALPKTIRDYMNELNDWWNKTQWTRKTN